MNYMNGSDGTVSVFLSLVGMPGLVTDHTLCYFWGTIQMNTKDRKKKPALTYHDLVPKNQIQTYLLKHTGQLVTPRRIALWIKSGDIPLIKFPRREGGGLRTRRVWLDALIRKYS